MYRNGNHTWFDTAVFVTKYFGNPTHQMMAESKITASPSIVFAFPILEVRTCVITPLQFMILVLYFYHDNVEKSALSSGFNKM